MVLLLFNLKFYTFLTVVRTQTISVVGKRTRDIKFVGSSKKRKIHVCDQAKAKSRTSEKGEQGQNRIETPKPSEPDRIVETLNEGKDNNNLVVEIDDCAFNGVNCEVRSCIQTIIIVPHRKFL